MKHSILLLSFCLAFAVLPCRSFASTAVRLSFDQLAARADRVVVAELLDRHSAWDSAGLRIFTHFHFRVMQDLAGTGEEEITLVQPGGTLGRLTQRTEGFARFEGSERQVLFLRRAQTGYQVVGMCQGVFQLYQQGAQTLFVQRLEGLHFVGDAGRPLILDSGEAIGRILTLFGARSRP